MKGLILGGVLLAACTGAPDGMARPESPAAVPSPTAGPAPYVRTCESSVYGDLGPGWRRGEVSAGPVVFVAARGYADDPRRRFRASGALATAQKILIVVEGDRPVVVSVRHLHAALFYDPERWGDRNIPRFDAGDPRVRFEPCGDQRTTQFNGAFLVRGPGCVPVEVLVEGAGPVVATLSFGAGACG